jgi:hypothetical protein
MLFFFTLAHVFFFVEFATDHLQVSACFDLVALGISVDSSFCFHFLLWLLLVYYLPLRISIYSPSSEGMYIHCNFGITV